MEGVNKKDRTAFLSTQEMRPRVIDTDDPDFPGNVCTRPERSTPIIAQI
jgi:hypothetical protein